MRKEENFRTVFNKVIKDAMKNKNCYVTLYFSTDGSIQMSIYPLGEEDKDDLSEVQR